MTTSSTEQPRTSAAPLFQTERQRDIAMLTRELGRVEVADLSERFQVTTETIRRDLSELQDNQLVRRVHGGAVPWKKDGFEPLLSVRSSSNHAEKQRIARRATREIPESGSIIIDSGSTLTCFAEVVPHGRKLQVVTNSLPIAQVLARNDQLEVIVLGGTLRNETLAAVDAHTVAAVEELTVDTLFISSDGISLENGLTTPYREEAALKRVMIRAARRVVALVDSSKFGHDHLVRFADWSDIDVLVTNKEVDPALIEAIEASGTSVLLS